MRASFTPGLLFAISRNCLADSFAVFSATLVVQPIFDLCQKLESRTTKCNRLTYYILPQFLPFGNNATSRQITEGWISQVSAGQAPSYPVWVIGQKGFGLSAVLR
jgi:hypothetical protein